MTRVAIVKCGDYVYDDVENAVRNALSLIGGLAGKIKKGDKVLLKPNMLMAADAARMVTTHPFVLRAAIKIVRECGGRPFVGDSPGNAYADVDNALEVSGFKAAAAEEGAELIKFTKTEKRGEVYIAKDVLDMDLIINLPKIKTHTLTLFTGAVKNMFGIVPGFHKGDFHKNYPYPADFAAKLVDIFSVKIPLLGIMDGIYGMEGEGPSAGKPRKIGLVLASFDCVALDSVSSRIIGYDPFSIDTTRIAHNRKLGEADLEKIEIKGERLQDVLIPDFKLTSTAHAAMKKIPRFIYPPFQYLARKLVKVYPAVMGEKCTGCGVCANNCPAGAITLTANKANIDHNKCISCYCCQELCSFKAIEIKRSWFARRFGIGKQ